jgi:hypothetical protein
MLLTKYSVDQNKKEVVDGTCGTYGEKEGVYRRLIRKP